LLMTVSEIKDKLRINEKGKHVNTKFDKSETSGTLLCVTRLPKKIAVKAKKVSITKVNADRSKPVTSDSIPKNEQSKKQSANVIARGMYRITETETQMLDSKSNINVSNSTCVESSNSVTRPRSKDNKSKDRVLKNTNDKRSSTDVRKMSSSVWIDSNKRETMHPNVCRSNASVLNTKTVNAVNNGLNIVCVSCGKYVFLLSHEKCVARYALSRDSKVKRALFTTPIATKSKNLGATSVVAKSRLSVAKTPTATNKVSRALPLSFDSSQSRTLSNYMKNKIATSRKWQKWFENQQCFNWAPKSKTAQSLPSETKSRIRVRSTSNTPVTTQKWVAKLSTLPSVFVSCDAVRFGNDHFATITGYGDYVQGNLTICHVYYVEGLDCEQGKSKKALLPLKLVPSTESKLERLHMDLCGPMRVASINGKKYILVIVDDYSRYTWVYFLHTKDEAPDMIIDFINQVQRNLKAQILTIRTDNGTEFKNEKLQAFYAKLGIVYKTSIAQMPQQNGVVERRNQTLIEPARTMIIFSKAPEFLWAEAIATACFTQNRSIVNTRHNKTPYELIRGRKPNV
ncbi:retrovirus-related pol polyprotein from transposon TNT 1-94, partial [Tanacetum coccineum]